ncbi:GxxExxY protein [Spirosoma endophyticum]|uniref:GxxExxY protein n=1 Tax=Spirosoma endophyticum TaxID=662367 RepID=A0A1I1U4D4_9BACT|nr:GxxExxY protein [Spirosoma endophyticum]SFD63563.1 GxxExxY protein [Spirosoma endophyticum]
MTENELSRVVFDCALKVHRTLGSGLLESAYEECLSYELLNAELLVERQKILPIVYESIKLDAGYRIDLMIEGKVIIESKAVEVLTDVHMAQVLTYLRLSECRLGLLINFNVTLLKNGMRRVVNNL